MRQTRFALASFVLLLPLALASPALGDPQLAGKTYHFGTHPARTNIVASSDAQLETIHARSNEMRGSVTVDASGKRASGTLRVAVSTLDTGIELRDEHLRSSQWMDAEKYPTIELRIDAATEGKDGKTWSYKGKLTIKGVTKDVSGSARITAFPDEIAKQLGPGSWLRVRTSFDVRITDFGIEIPQMVGAKVSEVWECKIDVYGTTAAPPKTR